MNGYPKGNFYSEVSPPHSVGPYIKCKKALFYYLLLLINSMVLAVPKGNSNDLSKSSSVHFRFVTYKWINLEKMSLTVSTFFNFYASTLRLANLEIIFLGFRFSFNVNATYKNKLLVIIHK